MEKLTNIFNKKTILKNIAIFNFYDLKEKFSIAKKWIEFSESGVLDKTKETVLQADFLNDFFGKILGYKNTLESSNEWTLDKETKTKADTTRADGALGYFSQGIRDIRVVIELKDSKTKIDEKQNRLNDKRTPVEQAFSYSFKSGKNCNWVIVSNYKEIRLYNSKDSNEYEVFFIKKLQNEDELKRFIFFLSCDNLISKEKESSIDILYRKNIEAEKEITKEFYNNYKTFRMNLFNHIKEKNQNINEILIFEKTQKLVDRFIFVCFCEDTGLLNEKTIRKLVEVAKKRLSRSNTKIWEEIKDLFLAIDLGSLEHNINRFNGGLFAEDTLIDSFIIEDAIFEELVLISDYDFSSDLNVNILGHIFEHSLNDMEEIKASISGVSFDEKKGKKKKDGIFYTPEYITKYIVKEAIGSWIEDRKKELGFYELPELTEEDKKIKYKNKKSNTKIYSEKTIKHIEFWENYKEKLKNIKVLDPACGSGAFLNQAFDYLLFEGIEVNKALALLREYYSFEDLSVGILKDNIFGVDLNGESVEITKLSLWLKTAKKTDPLTSLDNNIRCGNSLIDDESVVGEKAFKWEVEFKDIMDNGGFDIVIGNPPYVFARETISNNEKNYLTKNYKSADYQLNTFSLFIEKSINLLKNKNYLGFVIPNTLLKISSLAQIRRFIFENGSPTNIVQLFGYSFENVNVETVILIFSKKFISETIVTNIYDLNNIDFYNDAYSIDNISWRNDGEYRFQVSTDKNTEGLLEKIKKDTMILELTFEVKAGLQAYESGKGNPKQTPEDVKNRPYDFNYKYNETTHKYLEGKDIKRYYIDWGKTFLKYGENLAASRTFDIFERPRILIREITGKYPQSLICSYTEDILLNNRSIINVLSYDNSKESLKTLLLILSSSLISYYFQKVTPKSDRQMFPKLILKDLKEFPVKLPENTNSFVDIADKMIDLNCKKEELINKFVSYLLNKYNLSKVTGKISEFYLYDFNELLKELKKQKKVLQGMDEYNLKEIFDNEKSKVLEIKSEIEKTDKEIDKIVYDLYELTDEEIKIVENIKN